VNDAMVMTTQQDHVAQAGCAALDPVLDVVGVGLAPVSRTDT
jgi:hypothetical protein